LSLIRNYAFFMLIVNLSFALVNLAGLFPFETKILGLDIYDQINQDVSYLQSTFASSAGGMEYLAAAGMFLVVGGKIVLEFFLMVFFGFTALLNALNVPGEISTLVGTCTGALILYEFGSKLLGRG